MRNLPLYLVLLMMAVICFFMIGCDDSANKQGIGWHSQAKEGTPPPGFDTFIDTWNSKSAEWVDKQLQTKSDELGKLRREYVETNNKNILNKLLEATRSKDVFETRKNEGDYIQIKSTPEIPTNLIWEDGSENPEIGDPAAKKGGAIRLLAAGSYPDTFRPIGPNSNNSFRGKLYDEISIGLVRIHPGTGKPIPGLAKQWATGADGKTVFFRLDEDASYSDGTKVRAMDFLYGMYISTSPHSQSIGYENVYREMLSHITIYDEQTLSVSLPAPRPLLPFYCGMLLAFPPHFYSEFGPDYVEKYQWRFGPTTGAYTINTEALIRGRQVTMQRVKNWWAKDKKFFRYMYNVDNIVYNFIADESKAIELFRIGELDMMYMNKPEIWHDRMEIPEVHNGYINRATFFTIYPRPPIGIYLNTAKQPFNDKNIRLGMQHALNMQRIIDINFRGDYQRLSSYSSGYGRFTNSSIKAREYSPEKAREYFALSGFTETCPDGILKKADGPRLSAEITFSNSTTSLANIMSQLKEDARKCGIELRLDPLDSTVSFRKVMEKRHQSAFWAWGTSPPHPSTYQGFFSGYAYDSKGNVVPYTNNITSYSNPEMDSFVQMERDASTDNELEKASYSVQKKIHDEALWVPGWTTEFSRIAYWRWIRWPNSETTKFCFPIVFEPTESYIYWVDEEAKEETIKSKRHGDSLDEVDAVYDQYRFMEMKEDSSSQPIELPSVPNFSPSPPPATAHPSPSPAS